MFHEVQFLSLGEVTVTDRRLSVGGQSFSLEGLENVEVIYRHRNWMPELTLIAASALFGVFGLAMDRPLFQIAAVVLLMMTGIVFWNGGPRYAIALDTKNGRITPLTSSDRILVESVGQFLQNQFVQSKRRPDSSSRALRFPGRMAMRSRIAHTISHTRAV
jgi:hypothetical protein